MVSAPSNQNPGMLKAGFIPGTDMLVGCKNGVVNQHEELPRVLAQAEVLAQRWEIPSRMISLHRELQGAVTPSGERLSGKRQHTLRWGAFLLIYAPMESFFNEILGYRAEKRRTLPLHPDKVRDAAKQKHGVDLFTNSWSVRTRITLDGAGNRSRWYLYSGSGDVRDYLADMKSLRDVLSHGGDPYSASNDSGALWPVKKGASMRLMGVEGFLQACCDLVGQTVLSYGGELSDLPPWPEPDRSGLSAEQRPKTSLLP